VPPVAVANKSLTTCEIETENTVDTVKLVVMVLSQPLTEVNTSLYVPDV